MNDVFKFQRSWRQCYIIRGGILTICAMRISAGGYKAKYDFGSGGIRTHASEETGALNQRLRPLGHATLLSENSLSVLPNNQCSIELIDLIMHYIDISFPSPSKIRYIFAYYEKKSVPTSRSKHIPKKIKRKSWKHHLLSRSFTLKRTQCAYNVLMRSK